MMVKIVEFTEKNRFLGVIIKLICWICFFFLSLWDELCAIFRFLGVSSQKYKKLKTLKQINKHKRCFIICTGPSLTKQDLEKLKKEYTFGMNSICMLDDEIEFKPTYYGCADIYVYQKMEEKIKKYIDSNSTVFLSNRIARKKKVPKDWFVLPYHIAYHSYDRWFHNKFWCKFSKDCYYKVYDMFSVTHMLIQVAVYMGFHEIYLLGADCNFNQNGNIHFKEYGLIDTTIDTARERNIAGYLEVKKYAKKHGIKIFNATRGGNLEVFERVNLDDVLR